VSLVWQVVCACLPSNSITQLCGTALAAVQAQMAIPHNPIRASRAILRSLDRSEVLVMEWPCACLPNQYFRIMDPELVIVMDQVRAHANHSLLPIAPALNPAA
jgi:hypothetical protein